MREMNPRMKSGQFEYEIRSFRSDLLHMPVRFNHLSRGVLVVIGTLLLAGCGGGDSADTDAPVGLQTAPAAQPAEPAADKLQEEPAAEPEPKEEPETEEAMEEPAVEPEPKPVELPPEKRKRPEDFAEWTIEEFRDEHAQNGRRFQSAVKYLAENKSDDAETAQLLSDLLVYRDPEVEPPPETDDERELKRYEQRKQTKLDQARQFQSRQAPNIIKALGSVGGDVAIKTLVELIAGNIDSGSDSRRACEAALASLMSIENDQVQEFIYTAVTAPAELRPNDDGSFTPDQLQDQVLRALPERATPTLRTRLGEFAAKVGPDDRSFPQLWRLLSESRADNLQAQLLLYLSPKLEARESQQLHNLFTQHSQRALSHLLGIPQNAADIQVSRRSSRGGFGGGSSRKKEVENIDELTYETARTLWALRFLAAVSEEMDDVSDLGDGLQTISLIGSMPVPPIRQGIEGYLDEHWDEVAKQKTSQLPEKLANAMLDPALLLILKDVPRRRDPDVRAERRNGSSSTRSRARTSTNSNDPRQLREESQYIWMDTTELMVQAINARMLAAANADDKSDDVSEDSTTGEAGAGEGSESEVPSGFELPYQLHEGANVVATHHVSWPDDVQEIIRDQKLDPLEVTYVRAEGEGVLTKLATHYQRQLGKSQTRFLENEGRWLDAMEELDTGWNRSTDVVIRRADEKERKSEDERKRSRNEPEDLIVEILIVTTQAEDPEGEASEGEEG